MNECERVENLLYWNLFQKFTHFPWVAFTITQFELFSNAHMRSSHENNRCVAANYRIKAPHSLHYYNLIIAKWVSMAFRGNWFSLPFAQCIPNGRRVYSVHRANLCRKQLKGNVGTEFFHGRKKRGEIHEDAQQIPFFYLSPWYQVYKCERKRVDGGKKHTLLRGAEIVTEH